MIKPDERVDDLQYMGLRIIQNPEKFCFGCDAVELANFVTGRSGEKCIDLGSGTGIISILLAKKRGFKMTAVEIQEDMAEMSERSIALNGQQDEISVRCMRLQDAPAEFGRSFDAVVTNPPYRKLGSGFTQSGESVIRARHEVDVTLKEVIAAASGLVSTGGRFYMVCPTERMAEAISLCTGMRLEPKELAVLRPSENKPPHLFLLKCVYEGKTGLRVLPERPIKTYGME